MKAIGLILILFVLSGCTTEKIYIEAHLFKDIVETVGPASDIYIHYHRFSKWSISVTSDYGSSCGAFTVEAKGDTIQLAWKELKQKFECFQQNCKGR